MNRDKKPYAILVIEDNPGDFLLIEDFLHEQFTKPSITHQVNFQHASQWLQQTTDRPDVILLDLTLPDKKGASLVEAILNIAQSIPVIILTGFADTEFSTRSIALGIADYLIKEDLNAPMLYKSIVYSIERKRIYGQLQESERRFGLLFNLSPQPMWVYEEETLNFVAVNKAATDQYGYTEAEFMTMNLMDVNIPEEYESTLEALQKRKKIKDGIFKDHFQHRRKNGELIDVEVYSTPLLVENKPCRSAIPVDVTERNQFEQRVTKAIIKTQEEERYEIGGELHDNVCQLLATSTMSLGMLRHSDKSNFDTFFDATSNYINMAIAEIRNLSHRLAPAFFDDDTFEMAITSLVQSFNLTNTSKATIHYDAALDDIPIHRDLQLNLYRILQEQLRNITKYAKATCIEVSLQLSGKDLVLKISDNGKGFSPENVRTGIGMANMKRRAELFGGSFSLNTAPGEGCTVCVRLRQEA